MIHALARGTIAKNETGEVGLGVVVYSEVQKLTNENQGIVEFEKVKNPLQGDLSRQSTK
jgi:hypothetical protein